MSLSKRGVILAGGEGTRLRPATNLYNKHAAVVYDRPMISYPLETLGAMGCESVVIVTSPQGKRDLPVVLGDKEIPITYMVQPIPFGSADALRFAQGEVEGTFPVLCGDVYFDPPLPQVDEPTLFWNQFEGANKHSVWHPETNSVVEKPTRDIGNRAIVGYVYDEEVFEVIPKLRPTERGELELVDLHNWYLRNGAQVEPHLGFFGDMGTPDGLLRVANYVAKK